MNGKVAGDVTRISDYVFDVKIGGKSKKYVAVRILHPTEAKYNSVLSYAFKCSKE